MEILDAHENSNEFQQRQGKKNQRSGNKMSNIQYITRVRLLGLLQNYLHCVQYSTRIYNLII